MVFDLYHVATNEKNKVVLSSKQFEKLFGNLQLIIPIEEFLKSDADTVALQIFIAVNKPEKYQNRFDFKVSVRPELVHNLKCILNEEPPTKFTDIICNDLMKNFHITKQ